MPFVVSISSCWMLAIDRRRDRQRREALIGVSSACGARCVRRDWDCQDRVDRGVGVRRFSTEWGRVGDAGVAPKGYTSGIG
jgi:hypothetical protein